MKSLSFLVLFLALGALACNTLNGAGTNSPQTSEPIPSTSYQNTPELNPESTGAAPRLGDCPLFPPDNVWSARVDMLPVDPNSDAYIQSIGPDTSLHPDFGAKYDDMIPGIPITMARGEEPAAQVTFDYADESDPGPYLIPENAQIEGGPDADGDRHIIVVDQSACKVYELYYATPQSDGTWMAGSGAIFDLNSNALRPSGWTSADAAGLPIFAGLVRYDEVATGAIHHALRFTVDVTQRAFIWPARHRASDQTDTSLPPMGQRFRLKATFDISGFSPEVQVILQALKTYGMILADNGSDWYISGTPDERWDNDTLVGELRGVVGSDFEAVDESSLMIDPDSGATSQSTGAQPTAVATTQSSIPGSSGGGRIVFSTHDGHVYQVEARPGAQLEDLGARLDVLEKGGATTWVNISPNGAWYIFITEKGDPECVGWECLVVVPADISGMEVLKAGGSLIRGSSAAISSSGERVIFEEGDGPHETDLWVTYRSGAGWSAPVLITGDSPYAWNSLPTISDDGSKVVFDCGNLPYGADGTAVCEVGTDGSSFRVVIKPEDGPYGDTQNSLHHPDYAPDGRIVVEADWQSEQIWRLSSNGQPELVNAEFSNDNSPCVLPNGWIASLWLERPEGQGIHELKIMAPDGSEFFMVITGIDIADIGIGCGK